MRTREEQIEIANTILEQLGGRRFMVVTGAKNHLATEAGLAFSVPNGRHPELKRAVNKVRIDLTDADDYTVAAYYVRSGNIRQVDSAVGVCCDNLQDVFTSLTGLYTHL